MNVSQDEMQRIRADAEVAVIAMLKALVDDAGAINEAMGVSNVALELVQATLDGVVEASATLRTLRDEWDMSICADARESLSRLG